MCRIRKYVLSSLVILLVFLPAGCHTSHHAVSSSNPKREEDILRKKYAEKLGVTEKDITNITLYRFVDSWYGVPYKYGGKSKSGVDCSGFATALLSEVYKKNVAGSAAMLYEKSSHIPEKKLQEGDLVFFKINSDKVSHVGVYLQNGHFVHASVSHGVMIDALSEAYYTKYFYKGGRIK